MKIDLSNKRALITGSTAGIGFAIAQGLAQAGAQVILNGRTSKRVAAAVAELQSNIKNARVTGVEADCGTAEGAKRLVGQIPTVDILVNNVGIFEPKPFFEIPDSDWLRFFEINVMSAVRFSRHYTPGMVKAGWGRVLFVSSESGVQIPAEMVHYGMTKTAMLAVARGLAETVAGSGVTVNSILPGPTRSEGVGEFVEQLAKKDGISAKQVEEDFFKNMRPSSLIKRFATSEEVANMAVYLCSEQASATTGASVRVDGGVVRSII